MSSRINSGGCCDDLLLAGVSLLASGSIVAIVAIALLGGFGPNSSLVWSSPGPVIIGGICGIAIVSGLSILAIKCCSLISRENCN